MANYAVKRDSYQGCAKGAAKPKPFKPLKIPKMV